MELFDSKYDVCYDFCPLGDCCLSPALFYFKSYRDLAEATAETPEDAMSEIGDPLQLLNHVLHILCTILPALLTLAMARVVCQKFPHFFKADSHLRFFMEFLIFTMPTIFIVNIANYTVEFIVIAMVILIILLVWRKDCLQKASERSYVIGPRPRMLTLGRATINILTAYCILAIDFESFPKSFRKTRRYGAGLMDVGIGLFAFAMGAVSRRARRKADIKNTLRIVIPLILLGIARTVVILSIDYEQDDHEYGRHLNAFFTLGLTKLFGTLVGAVATTDKQLLPLSFLVLIIHEAALQFGIAEFVMSEDVMRLDFIKANREGLLSLPGFVAIYIVSMFLGYMWRSANIALNFREIIAKIKSMSLICISFWLLTIVSIFTVGIARVTCNFGYVSWIMGIASLMVLLFMIIFDVILNTLWPVKESLNVNNSDGGEGASLVKNQNQVDVSDSKFALPVLVDALNMNGLVFFLIANVLTGCVNIVWDTSALSYFTGYVILFIYMLIATGFVYIMYRLKVRIG